MIIALVFILIVAAIGATVYLGANDNFWIDDKHIDECQAERNVICLYCFGLVELNCGCPLMPGHNWCKCAEPQRSDVDLH